MAEWFPLAETYAETTSAGKHVVPALSLARRRFHTEVLELLIAIPRPKKEGKKKNKGRRAGDGPSMATVISSVAEIVSYLYLGYRYELSTY